MRVRFFAYLLVPVIGNSCLGGLPQTLCTLTGWEACLTRLYVAMLVQLSLSVIEHSPDACASLKCLSPTVLVMFQFPVARYVLTPTILAVVNQRFCCSSSCIRSLRNWLYSWINDSLFPIAAFFYVMLRLCHVAVLVFVFQRFAAVVLVRIIHTAG